ncbi:MAG: GGDEF domain-containing protein [Campylobacter sp.]|nr:GGDEF domain-containing protein [Campylobacter sp.]
MLALLRNNSIAFFNDMRRIFKDYKTMTLNDVLTIISCILVVTVALFYPPLYYKYEQYWAIWYDVVDVSVLSLVTLFSYHRSDYVKIMFVMFYTHLVITMLFFCTAYGFESGEGTYIFLMLLLNYFIGLENKKLSLKLAIGELVFITLLFTFRLVIFPFEPDENLRTFYDRHFLNCAGAVILAVCMFLFLYTTILNSIYEKRMREKDSAREISRTDFLTGLLNRRAMREELQMDMLKANGVQSLAMLICDIDHFKNVNDTYGHICGDQVIKIVSEKLLENFRKEDLVCRWGGEEFLILCKNLDYSTLKSITERTRKNIEDYNIQYKGQTIKISLTFGSVYCDNLDACDFEYLIKQADELLYEGKINGRNQARFKKVIHEVA